MLDPRNPVVEPQVRSREGRTKLSSGLLALLLLASVVFLPMAVGAAEAGPRLQLLTEPSSTASLIATLQAGDRGIEREYGSSRLQPAVGFGGGTCVFDNIACNSTVSGNLTNQDCDLDGGFYADFWSFNGASGQTVTINSSSTDFDTFLSLLNPVPQIVAEDDDGGPGTNSRIVHNIGSTGSWSIAVQNFFSNELGTYTLSLDCSGGGGGSPPAAPSNLTATTTSTTEIQLRWTDNSNNEDDFQIDSRFPGGTFQNIGSVPANSIGVNIIGLSPQTAYEFRVRARNGSGNSAYTNTVTATTAGQGGQTCVPDAATLCLQNDRFRVEADWRRPGGQVGFGSAVELTPDTGYFWFFNAANVEMVVKILNNCNGGTNRFWVFAGGLTNVEVTLTVTDTDTGLIKTYQNPLGEPFQPIQDTGAFATCP